MAVCKIASSLRYTPSADTFVVSCQFRGTAYKVKLLSVKV